MGTTAKRVGRSACSGNVKINLTPSTYVADMDCRQFGGIEHKSTILYSINGRWNC